ncbi:MAG: DUF3817 domain-containing protein [Pseudomonas sp.]|uniref:DUF3817 domain-containing protein n=1 Tax=Pseudomonas sp. TaxID=306 RepID=UPI003BB4E3FD
MNHRPNLGLIGWLRCTSLFEGLTLLALVGIAVSLKYLSGIPGLVSVIDPIHGGAFLVFLVVLLALIPRTPWTRVELARLAIGAFVNAKLLQRKAQALHGVPTGQHKLQAAAKTR